MKLLVIGSGGREHAIAYALKHSPSVSKVYCAPGNPGMGADNIILVPINEMDFPALIAFVKAEEINWTFVGPEVPLAAGITDAFVAAGCRIFGPSAWASQLESSKKFAKDFMRENQIPTADYAVFTELAAAKAYLKTQTYPVVIKEDGLAAGKGVTIAEDEQQAIQTLTDFFKIEKQVNRQIVIESYLTGEEFSMFVLSDGITGYPLPIAQDHKRAFDGDTGPNTGGMGAYSGVPQINQKVIDEVMESVARPTITGMANLGHPFIGVIYIGLMLTMDGPKVIEYNVRFGDPETQIVLPQITSDFAAIITDLLNQQVPTITIATESYHLGVVVAADGYPVAYQKSIVLPELKPATGIKVFYAGVAQKGHQLASNGGRVLMVTSVGRTLNVAQKQVYDYLYQYEWEGFFFRHDIGYRAIKE